MLDVGTTAWSSSIFMRSASSQWNNENYTEQNSAYKINDANQIF
ncbi:hypothetical protein C1A50_3259 [Paenibacillus polymyxa]|nr:hypothetical protein C1A50_3259 [Paenibacillus polymyxa]